MNYYDYIGLGRVPVSNGNRVKHPQYDQIFLIDNGKRRLIADGVYNTIFRDLNGIILDTNLYDIPQGYPLVDGTCLFACPGGSEIYLYDKEDGARWYKRWIVNSATYNAFNFDWNKFITGNYCYIPNGSYISI